MGFAARGASEGKYRSWTITGGGVDQIRYSELNQIHRGNISKLQLAWKYDTKDAFEASEMQCNPIIVDGLMYATTPRLRVIALDAATGTLKWSFDPNDGKHSGTRYRHRGMTYWTDGKEGRLFFGAGSWLYALDAKTGKRVPGFGKDGRLDLREGLGRDPETLNVGANSPGVIYKDLLILGSIVSEDLPSAPGDIRAYDVRTGQLHWNFHTIPRPGEFGYETWPKEAWKHAGGANSWPGLALDAARGIVFAPTGSAAFDYYGADRAGNNLFANSLLALKADTGERLWHFQFIRHDVWDRDLPAPPSLVTLRRNGRNIDAVAQITKSGHVYVFERETGKPLFPMEDRKAPQDAVDGEALAATQPFLLEPPPFVRQSFTEDIVTKRTPEAHKSVLERFRKLKNGTFVAPSNEGTIIFPGLDGGGEWGGASWDPETGLFYVNANEMAWILKLVPRTRVQRLMSARQLYSSQCASCHKEDLSGTPPEFPSLRNLSERSNWERVRTVITKGAGRMPAFAQLGDNAADGLTALLLTADNRSVRVSSAASTSDLKYRLDGYVRFEDPEGYPAVTPPWGTLSALDLNTGKYKWQIPFGEIPALVAQGLRNTGSENYGGGVVTKGGLLFIGATNYDHKFRAFDKLTGKVLWETTLDAAGNATPAVYEVNGRQFVVIGAGGGKWKRPSGGTYYAYALPR